MATEPDFINVTQDDILTRFVANYQLLTGKSLQPAQAEQLIINAGAYEVYLQALRVQKAAVQNLVQFATGFVLDSLAKLFNVTRLPAQAASCKATLVLIAGHGDLVIPAGTRIQSQDGLATFTLQEATPVASDTDSVIVDLLCDTTGIAGNNYLAGQVNVILDPQAYLVSAVNNDMTVGGSDIESDDNLRERIYDAPSAYSVAGSKGAYKYFAKSASPLIIDVAVPDTPGEGLVQIYPLVDGGPTPQEILDSVEAACNPDEVRPLTDTVKALSPTFSNYNIDIGLVLYGSADSASTLSTSYNKVYALAMANNKKLGLDAVISQLVAAASIDGSIYKVVVNSPANDIVVDPTHVAYCTGVNVHIVGINNEK